MISSSSGGIILGCYSGASIEVAVLRSGLSAVAVICPSTQVLETFVCEDTSTRAFDSYLPIQVRLSTESILGVLRRECLHFTNVVVGEDHSSLERDS